MLYTKDVTLTDATLTTVLTVPSGYVAHWSLLFVGNHGGSTKAITVYIDKVSGGSLYIVDGVGVNSKTNIQFSDGIVVLQPGDSIKAQAEASSNFGVICTIDLLPAPAVTVEFNGS